MDEQDYNSARIYFESAYAFGRQMPGFDVYQIDNHYARYLLENGAKHDVGNEFMKVFRQSHNIVTDRSHRKVQKYYPFKVARHYLEFVMKYAQRLTSEEKDEIRGACNYILNMIDEFRVSSPDYGNRKDVRECEINMKHILSDYV